MWIGFQDDPNLRWNDHRPSAREQTVAEHATMLRTWVYWPYVAPTQPTDPTDSDDPAYNFKDIDEFVRQAQIHGQEVLLTLWGTPNWANGGKGPNQLPTNIGAFRQFATPSRTATTGARRASRSCASTRSGTSRTWRSSSRRSSPGRRTSGRSSTRSSTAPATRA